MSKKENKTDKSGSEIIGKLSEAQYWRWRITIEEMDHSKSKQEISHCHCKLKQLEIEKTNLQLVLSRKTFQNSQEAVKLSKEAYDHEKQKIENEVGVSFNGCVIDPHTYEIKKLEEEKK